MDALTSEELCAYFGRVDLEYDREAIKPTLNTLCKLHFAHVQTIPYENLSLHLEKARQQFPKIELDKSSLVNKIIRHGRGGYCFESNLLFLAVLKACGFATYVMAVRTIRVMQVVVPNQVAPHIAIGVVLDGVHWHCDVGYGGRGVRLPIRNDLIHITQQTVTVAEPDGKDDSVYSPSTVDQAVYKDVNQVWQAAHGKCTGYGHRLRTKRTPQDSTGTSAVQVQMPALYLQALDSKGDFQDQYYFYLQDTTFAEFLMLNWYTSTCPLANHLNSVNVAMQTQEGRHTYDGKEFKVFEGTKLTWIKTLETEDEVYVYLKKLFNLTFDS